jgi:hypothetical protein
MKKLIVSLALCLIFVSGAIAGDVKFGWDNYSDLANIDGFRLYKSAISGTYVYGSASPNFVANISKDLVLYTAFGLPAGKTYFVLTAYKGTIESGPSNEVNTTIGLNVPTTFKIIP